MSQLSGYRIMWLLVMFDLPVVEDEERKQATQFRNALLDMGFEMAQFSVYMRFAPSKKAADRLAQKIEAILPPGGKVDILSFTDKQYENIAHFQNGFVLPARKSYEQFSLF